MFIKTPGSHRQLATSRLAGVLAVAGVGVGLCVFWEEAEDGAGEPRPGEAVLRINEVMTGNRSTLLDDDDEYSDWVEIVNAGQRPVNLKGYALSDNKRDPLKWEFPPIVIKPGEHLVVFTSNKNKVGPGSPLHTNFKLKSKGEAVLLTDAKGWLLDYIEFEELPPDHSFGRDPGKHETWLYFAEATPRESNHTRGWESLTGDYTFEGSPIVINEVQSSNRNTLFDEDGDFSDWIELANTSDGPVDLEGYGLSDDATTPAKWRFPALSLEAGGYLVVFASGKDRDDPKGRYLHTNFKLNPRRDQLILSDRERQVLDQLGARGRRPGISVGRGNENASDWLYYPSPTPGAKNTTQGLATFPEEFSALAPKLRINEVMGSNRYTLRDDNREFSDWIELYNGTTQSVSLGGYHLSDDKGNLRKWAFPEVELPADGFLVVFASGKDRHDVARSLFHSNFGIRAGGETLFLTDTEGRVTDVFRSGRLGPGISSGRGSEGLLERVYFEKPTPGRANDGTGGEGFSTPPHMVPPGGSYPKPTVVRLESSAPNVTIRYTTDGSKPHRKSKVYSKPIFVGDTTIVRARAWEDGALASKVSTATYLVGEEHTLAVVSVAIDPDHMFHPMRGLHSMGPNASPVFPHEGANFWSKRELPCHVELFETDGALAFKDDVGFKIFGAFSRGESQKSFLLTTRDRYGSDLIRYPLFDDKPELVRHKALILRTSGQDWHLTKIRDVLMTRLVKHLRIDYQAYRPAVLYINGEYFGLYNVREKINEQFVAYNHELNPDEINLVQANRQVNAGSGEHFFALKRYVRSHDLSQDEHYQKVQAMMDVPNFIDYQIAEVFFANTDNGNIRRWRDSSPDGKWRWILYDLDWGFRKAGHKTLSRVTNPRGTGAMNMFSTAIMTALLKNADFRKSFAERFAYHLNTTFEPQRVLSMIDELAEPIRSEIPRHMKRWRRSPRASSPKLWETRLQRLRDFAVNRPPVVKAHVKEFFGLSDSEMALMFEEPAPTLP